MSEREDLTFSSGEDTCAAWLYRPDGAAGPVPCVVMAHGFTATRGDRLPAYAERFAAAGLAVLLFDYRHFGDSSGAPRQLLDIGRQQADYHAAVAFARTWRASTRSGSRSSARRSRAATSSPWLNNIRRSRRSPRSARSPTASPPCAWCLLATPCAPPSSGSPTRPPGWPGGRRARCPPSARPGRSRS